VKWAAPFILVLMVGCRPIIRDSIVVDVADKEDTSALLSLCRANTPMRRSGSRFEVTYPIDCEGDGVVRVRYADGGSINCPVGYVTPYAGQKWRFAVQHRSCRWLLAP
jgi:hypothetical protein